MRARLLLAVALAAGAVGFLAGRQLAPAPEADRPVEPRLPHPSELREERPQAPVEKSDEPVEVSVPPSPPPHPPETAPDLYVGSLVDTPDGTLKVVKGKNGYALVKHGLWTERYPDGRKASEVEYIEGAPEGLATYWHAGGALRQRGSWRAGKKHGVWSEWDERGNLLAEEVWENGILVRTAEVPEPTAEQMEKARVNGKYGRLLVRVPAPEDRKNYGDFRDYGHYGSTDYRGVKGIPEGYWVYVYPWWYIWGDKLK